MTHHAPPIVKAAERLLKDIEEAVKTWPVYHKNSAGKALRKQALAVTLSATMAYWEPEERLTHLRTLKTGVQALKILLQLGFQLKAMRWGQFNALARQAHQLGSQVGGWWKDVQHPQAQSPAHGNRGRERGQELSTRTAFPRGANR
jgi:hypothetical protein